MAARIIDGKTHAAAVREEVAARVARAGVKPGFVDLLVGDDPASAVYVGMKNRAAEKLGMRPFDRHLPASATQEEVLAVLDELNADPDVHGIIVQLPLPGHIDEFEVLNRIDVRKDVDGFSVQSQGLIAVGKPGFLPATPAGIVELMRRDGIETSGAHVVIVGRSNLVGRPLSIMLSQKAEGANATVTLCHTGTKDLASHTRAADIIIVAAGRPKTLTGDMVRPGATVLDVGTHKQPDGSLIGDVDFDAVAEVAGAITPVPGGVGPMTVAVLMDHVARAAGC